VYLGYNSNGFANHDPVEAIEIIAETGYAGIGITIDHHWLNPFAEGFGRQLDQIVRLTELYRLKSVVETGARFLLNPRIKHEPTLISHDEIQRNIRIDFLKRCIDIAAVLNSDCVSLWSGVAPDGLDLQTAMDRLASSLEPVIRHAEGSNVKLGFEPEPGMLIDTMSAMERLLQWIDSPVLQMTLDLGHLFCQGEVPIAGYVARWSPRIINVHIEDMRAGVHEHLMFGDGQMHFPPIIAALRDCRYEGGVFVELSRHSHDAVSVARRSFDFLDQLVNKRESSNDVFDQESRNKESEGR
jgi:sugar phosphate isomerase/epimerase